MSAIALGTVCLGNSAGPSKLPGGVTVTLELLVALWFAASVAVTVKLKLPVAAGVPPKSPFTLIEVPGGVVPAEMLQL